MVRSHIIPRLIVHNPWTRSRIPMEVMRDGQSVTRFQAWQQCSTMSSWSVKMRFDSQLSRMNCRMFLTGLSDRVDHVAVVADRGPKGLRLAQRRELLLRPVAGRAAPGSDKVGRVLQAECLKGCQELHGGLRAALRWLQTAAEIKREQLPSH